MICSESSIFWLAKQHVGKAASVERDLYVLLKSLNITSAVTSMSIRNYQSVYPRSV